jgi:hypothetical protein
MIETVSVLEERIEVITNEIMEIKSQIAKTDSITDLSRLCEEMQHMINCLNENYKKAAKLKLEEITEESGTQETICLSDVERTGIHKYINKPIRLTYDILSWNAERVIKRAGAGGTLISIHNYYNRAVVRIGKRNYDICFSEFEVIL